MADLQSDRSESDQTSRQSPSSASLAESLHKLQQRVSELESLESEHAEALKNLSEREAFNFALFHYNPLLTVVVDRDGKVIKSNMAKQKSGDRLPNIGDIMYRDYAAHHEINMYDEMIDSIKSGLTKRFPEQKYGSRILSITISPFPKGAIITSQDITVQKQTEQDRLNLISDLRRALDEVETLRGLLPICACCKKIRDDNGYWNHIEVYISKHTLADFTHTMCPDCVKKFYPEFWEKMQEKREGSSVRKPN